MADEEKAAAPKRTKASDDPLAQAQEQGYIGTRPESEYDDEEYSLQSGPDSPPYPLGK